MAIETESQFGGEDVPEAQRQQKKWSEELKSSHKNFNKFLKRAEKSVERYTDKRTNEEGTDSRLNLYHSNVNILKSFLFGNAPKTDVSRRYADADDDTARVAAEIYSRILNNDIEESGNDFTSVLQSSLDDRLICGLGIGRVRYVLDTFTEEFDPIIDDDGTEIEAAYSEEKIISEEADIEYVHWRDVRWSWCRTWKDMRWIAFRVTLTEDEFKERFDTEEYKASANVEFKVQGTTSDEGSSYEDIEPEWQETEVWEIWNKKDRKVYWLHESCDQILDIKEDPLQLKGFFPCPKFMTANTTTTLFMPCPDFYFAQDLYNQIDYLENRIQVLAEAVKAVGAYDSSQEGLRKMLEEGFDNDLVPIKDWHRFAEKGGLEGAVDWMPIEPIVKALEVLVGQRERAIQLLYQITGLSDILRGQSGEKGRVSAAEQKIKAQFGSIRIQSLQDEFARFASELSALKAEVISNFFSEETIVEQSNMLFTKDQKHLPAAIDLIKNLKRTAWRIEIKPETVAMTDYAQLQQERTEYLNSLAVFMQSAVPLVQLDAAVAPVLLEMLKWGLAGFKGSKQIEGVLDTAIEQITKSMQQPKPPKEDPKVTTKKLEGEQKMQQIEATGEQDRKTIQADTMSDIAKQESQNAGTKQNTALKGLLEIVKEDKKAKAKNND